MRIFRSSPDDHFTIIPNETLRDQRLSYNARGVLIELLSHMDGWDTNADTLSDLARKHRDAKVGEGRRGIRMAFAELEECGYLIRRRVRVQRGQFVTVLELYDIPQHRDTATGTSADNDVWTQASDRGTAHGTSVDGTSVDGTSVSGTSKRSTDLRSTNEEVLNEEHSSSLVITRAAAAHAAARDRDSELNDLYQAVNRLDEHALRHALLAFENRRPRIYRKSRVLAVNQLNDEDRRTLKSEGGSVAADRLTYKYALLHYRKTADDWPAWLIRPLPWPVHLKSVS